MRVVRALVPLFILLSPPLRGGHVIEYQSQITQESFISHETTSQGGHVTAYISLDRGRLDEGNTSYVLRSDLGKFWVVLHGRRTYWELDAPVRLEAEVTDGSREALAQSSPYFAAHVEVTATDEVGKIGSWPVEHWEASVQQPNAGLTRNIDLWLDPSLDLALFRALIRNVAELNVFEREWYGEILALEGLTVKYEEKSRSRTKSRVTTKTLVSLREEALDKALFEVPEGYVKKDLPLEALFSIQAPREPPPR